MHKYKKFDVDSREEIFANSGNIKDNELGSRM